jgi:membrane protein involved in colicin uptake
MPNEVYTDEEGKPSELIITDELIETLEKRISTVASAMFGSIPDEIVIDSNGSIIARYITSGCCGDPDDVDNNYISVDSLNKDVERLEKERIEREERIKKEREERRLAELKAKEERERQQRRQKYLELHKEFGDKPFTT